MSNEVSCSVLHIFFKGLKERDLGLERMVEGTSISVAKLRNKKERIDWADFLRIMRNLRPIFTDAELVELGRAWMHQPGLKFASVVARLLFTPMDFYRWMNKPKDGLGNQMFSCIVPTHTELSSNEIQLDLTVTQGYEVPWEFFIVSSGNMEELPCLLGHPRADVRLSRIPSGGRFHITVHQARKPLARRMRDVVTWPFTVRTAARELKDAHETLQQRYDELESARVLLAEQARQLTAANHIAALALGDLSATATMRGVCAALVEHAGCDEAVLVPTEGPQVAALTERADDRARTQRTYQLARGKASLGQLTVTAVEGDEATAQLVESLVPTIALVVQRALDQQAVADYQADLERRVADRTRELTRARDELAGTVAHLEEARATREKLFHNISHEIRTPLSLVLLLVNGVLVHHRGELTERAIGQLGSITASTRKLVRLVDELLLLASGDERDLQVTAEPVELTKLMPELVAGWQLAAEEAGLRFTVDVPARAPVEADVVALERVLSNLLSNAIKFTPRGGAIALDVRPDGERTTIIVRDTGPGIDDELRARLFGRFEQGAAGRNLRAGSGIGLSIARELVRAHGGDLIARPNPAGQGTEFVFTLATTTSATVDKLAPGKLRPTDYGVGVIGPATTTRPPGISLASILVAEDDPGLASALAQLLGEEYTVTLAHDGASALAAATAQLPDLLITDIEMPGIDGLDLARQVRALPGETATPVIIMSARAKLGDRLAGFEAGAIDYLVKPFDPAELHARVRSQLGFRHLAQKLQRTEKLAALGTLSAGLAHELRNPANGIVNAMAPLRELLPAEVLAPEHGVGELLDVMAQCAEQVAYVSRQLLGFRRSGELELRRVALAEVLSRALSNVSPQLAGVTLRQETSYSGTLRCAAPLLTQVLINLLENAAQAAGPGGWVELATRGTPQSVVIEVSDSGPGVPPALHEKVFEPFFTTKPPGQGTGLGLATARDLIHRHGGTLEIKMREHQTVFAIELPQSPEVR